MVLELSPSVVLGSKQGKPQASVLPPLFLFLPLSLSLSLCWDRTWWCSGLLRAPWCFRVSAGGAQVPLVLRLGHMTGCAPAAELCSLDLFVFMKAQVNCGWGRTVLVAQLCVSDPFLQVPQLCRASPSTPASPAGSALLPHWHQSAGGMSLSLLRGLSLLCCSGRPGREAASELRGGQRCLGIGCQRPSDSRLPFLWSGYSSSVSLRFNSLGTDSTWACCKAQDPRTQAQRVAACGLGCASGTSGKQCTCLSVGQRGSDTQHVSIVRSCPQLVSVWLLGHPRQCSGGTPASGGAWRTEWVG